MNFHYERAILKPSPAHNFLCFNISELLFLFRLFNRYPKIYNISTRLPKYTFSNSSAPNWAIKYSYCGLRFQSEDEWASFFAKKYLSRVEHNKLIKIRNDIWARTKDGIPNGDEFNSVVFFVLISKRSRNAIWIRRSAYKRSRFSLIWTVVWNALMRVNLLCSLRIGFVLINVKF